MDMHNNAALARVTVSLIKDIQSAFANTSYLHMRTIDDPWESSGMPTNEMELSRMFQDDEWLICDAAATEIVKDLVCDPMPLSSWQGRLAFIEGLRDKLDWFMLRWISIGSTDFSLVAWNSRTSDTMQSVLARADNPALSMSTSAGDQGTSFILDERVPGEAIWQAVDGDREGLVVLFPGPQWFDFVRMCKLKNQDITLVAANRDADVNVLYRLFRVMQSDSRQVVEQRDRILLECEFVYFAPFGGSSGNLSLIIGASKIVAFNHLVVENSNIRIVAAF